MKYVKHYVQKTIKTESPEEFDELVNGVYVEAAASGKEPEIHFFNVNGFCASIKYYISITIPESLSEEYELKGLGQKCGACPYCEAPKDKRYKVTVCKKTEKRTYIDINACDLFYKEFMEACYGKN